MQHSLDPAISVTPTRAEYPSVIEALGDASPRQPNGVEDVGQGRHSRVRHGLTDTPTHRSWMAMRQRCTNRNDRAWKNYGGRGITVCVRWAVFTNFLTDMGLAPPGYEIERIDVNGNYEPGNCRWATVKEQANNKRTNRLITHRGRTRTLTQWAEELGLKMHTLYRRIVIKQMPLDLAMRPAVLTSKEAARLGAAARWAGDRIDPLTRKRQKLLQLPRAAQATLLEEGA